MEAKAVQRHLRRSPRKIRLVADMVRGKNVNLALGQLKYQNKAAASELAKVIMSAAANLKDKFQDERIEDEDLYVKTVFVDGGAVLKRIQPAPQGRAYQIRKRSSHITVVVATRETLTNEEA